MKLEYSEHVFERYSSTKFHANTSGTVELFHAGGWTDIHDEANSHFSQFSVHA